MKYQKELDFIVAEMKKAYIMFSVDKMNITQKAEHDLVTNIDNSIEDYLTDKIKTTFENDKILGEETSSNTRITERTWTIDPIDGTCNMASGIGLYGIQCSLIENHEIVLAAIYIPSFDYLITAIKGSGCFLNGERVCAKKNSNIKNAIISFGDYPHKNSDRIAQWQHNAIRNIFSTVSKIRMFGSAAIDFSFVATGKTDGTVVITRNLWDIAPGVLACKEAGAIVVDLYGNDFSEKSDGVIVGSDSKIANLLVDAFAHKKDINPIKIEKSYDGVIFDFDGVILDTEKYHYLSWKKVFEKYNITFSSLVYENLKSTGREQIIQYVDEKFDLKLSEAEKENISRAKGELYIEYTAGINENDFVPYVLEYIEFLRRNHIKIGIASSSKAVKQYLNKFGLNDYFDVVIDGNDNLPSKPNPSIFLETAKRLNASPEKCLVFEDALAGIDAAVAGGFDVIFVGNSKHRDIPSIKDFSPMVTNC